MRRIVLLLLCIAAACCEPPIQVKRKIGRRIESDFRARMHAFLSRLPSTSGFQPHPNGVLDAAPESSAAPWKEATCKDLNLRFKHERNLSPEHTRSSLHLVRTQSGRLLVRKVHGYAHSYNNELKFYKRVKHVLVSAAVCWEPASNTNVPTGHVFLDQSDGHSTSGSSSDDYDDYDHSDDDYEDYDHSDDDYSTDEDYSTDDSAFSSTPVEQQKAVGKINSDGKKSDKALLVDYIPGGQSGDWLYDLGFQEHDEQKSEEIVRKLVSQLVDAIHAVHQAGMVHGDVKPENILITQSLSHASLAEIRLIDFDLSADAKQPRLRAGTRTTMSPEVAMVIDAPANEASDWWSVGATVLLWVTSWNCGRLERRGVRGAQLERLCAYRPFQFIRLENRIAVKDIPAELDIPERLGKLIAMLLDPSPERRRFICREDLDALRKASGLQAGNYNHIPKYYKGDATEPPPRHRRRRRSMHAVANDQDEPRCDEHECIKDGQEPLFLRRPLQ